MLKVSENYYVKMEEIERLRLELGLSTSYVPAMKRIRTKLAMFCNLLEHEAKQPKLKKKAQALFNDLVAHEREKVGADHWKVKFICAYGSRYIAQLNQSKRMT